jgi:hypothetical protein
MPYNWMPSWAKSKLYGLIGSLLGGIASGVGWHFLAVHIDPPKITIYAVEAVLVAVLILLKKPKTPTLLILAQFKP